MTKWTILSTSILLTTGIRHASSFVTVHSALSHLPPTPKWMIRVPGTLEAGNAVTVSPDDTRIFVTTSNCDVTSLDPITGTQIASFRTSDARIPDFSSSPYLKCESNVVFYTQDASSPYLVFSARITIPNKYPYEDGFTSFSHILALSYPDITLKWVSPRLEGASHGAGTPVISSDGKYIFMNHNQERGFVNWTATFTILNAADGTFFYQKSKIDDNGSWKRPWGPPALYPNPKQGFYPGGENNTNDLVIFACSHSEYDDGYWDYHYDGCLYAFQFPIGFDGTSTDGVELKDELSWLGGATVFPPAIGLEGLSLYVSVAVNQVCAWYGDDPHDESLMFDKKFRYSTTLYLRFGVYPPATRPVFNSDESQIYVASEGVVHALNYDLTENFNITYSEYWISTILPSPDDSTIFIADEAVHGHSAVDGTPLFRIISPAPIRAADMSTDSKGETLYFGDWHGNIVSVDLTPYSCVGDLLDASSGRRSLGRGEYICSNGDNNTERFGLSQTGLLTHVCNGVVNWNSGIFGSVLYLQLGDGNLVLRDENEAVIWATGCPSPGASLVFKNNDENDKNRVTLVGEDGSIVWRVWETGRPSVCFPGDTAPTDQGLYKCVADKLYIGSLGRNEYLCDNESGYRFGLDANGVLGEWRNFDLESFSPEYDLLLWSPGYTGDVLKMQVDGNLVLKDAEGKIVWATQCPAPAGERVFLHEPGLVDDGGGIRIVADESNDIIWRVWDNGLEGRCGGSAVEPPTMTCKGIQLGQADTDTLGNNEYLCENPKDDDPQDGYQGHRLGLNDRGQLVLWDGFKTIWSPGFAVQGDTLRFVRVSGNGNGAGDTFFLQLQAGGSTMWSSCISSEGTMLQLKSKSAQLVYPSNGHVYWYVDYESGSESFCDPPNVPPEIPCTAEALEPETDCQMRVVDLVNPKYIELDVERFTDIYTAYHTFEIVNGDSDCSTEWRVEGTIHDSGFIDIVRVNVEGKKRPGSKYTSCTDLAQKYAIKNSSDFLFVEVPNYPCTKFAKDLVYYVVHDVLDGLDPAIMGQYSEY